MISVVVSVEMLFLLNNPLEMVDLFLDPLRKYIYIGETIKLEDQIRGRKAIWLGEVKRYLRLKLYLELRVESFVEERKLEIVNNEIIIHKVYVKWRIFDPKTYRSNLKTLFMWKNRLISKYQSIEVCYI